MQKTDSAAKFECDREADDQNTDSNHKEVWNLNAKKQNRDYKDKNH